MAKRTQKTQVKTESRRVGGHLVEYRKTGGAERVTVDGEAKSFFRVGKEYQLEANAYGESCSKLLDAAEAYARTLPTRGE